MGEIVLVRHGETEWSSAHRHTSVTDMELTETGRKQAAALRTVLGNRRFAAVWCSPRIRAMETADLAGLSVTGMDADLIEWNYGKYEGVTTEQIRQERPEWNLWRDGCPGGESPEQIGERIERVLDRGHALMGEGDVALVGHAHAFRVAAARWVGLPVAGGGLFRLDTATISTLGFEREQPVITQWNVAS
jgi:broad specificity phosphatase PhoE